MNLSFFCGPYNWYILDRHLKSRVYILSFATHTPLPHPPWGRCTTKRKRGGGVSTTFTPPLFFLVRHQMLFILNIKFEYLQIVSYGPEKIKYYGQIHPRVNKHNSDHCLHPIRRVQRVFARGTGLQNETVHALSAPFLVPNVRGITIKSVFFMEVAEESQGGGGDYYPLVPYLYVTAPL